MPVLVEELLVVLGLVLLTVMMGRRRGSSVKIDSFLAPILAKGMRALAATLDGGDVAHPPSVPPPGGAPAPAIDDKPKL